MSAETPAARPHTLLVATVGGTTDPIVQSLIHWEPARVVFLPSRESRTLIAEILRIHAERTGRPLGPGCYEDCLVDDPQDLTRCLDVFRSLDDEVRRWRDRGSDFQVVVDFTGGTKCMTAALALHARRWPCTFSYIGGRQRSKDGLGVVESGTETPIESANPWDALGYQALEEYLLLFDRRDFASAAAIVGPIEKYSSPPRKREMSALLRLAEAYDRWDRFDHKEAANRLRKLSSSRNDLAALLGKDRADRLFEQIEQNLAHLEAVTKASGLSRPLIVDLLGNAERCRARGRFDDAVARLYRAIEALAQLRLKRRYEIATERVAIDRVPEALRSQWQPKAQEGNLKLGLQDAYELLRQLDDPWAAGFFDSKLHGDHSPLVARNQSILAHGFQPISEQVFQQLWDAAQTLIASVEADDITATSTDSVPEIPDFPRFGPETQW